MRRRSRAASGPVKARRRKTAKLKPRDAPKVASRRSSAGSQDAGVARLTRELTEAAEQQAATADVLNVISKSTYDLQTVLNTLVETAARICGADMACIVRPQGSYVQFMATYGFSQAFFDVASSTPIAPGRWTLSGRVLADRCTVHIADVLADPEYTFSAAQKIAGFRSGLGVPLMREGAPIGVLNLWRSQVQPFTDNQIALVTSFAAQAVIAIQNTRLLNELRQRTDDLTEALDQQTATSEVLQVISSSPGDLQPVFATMLEKAVRICDAKFGTLYLHEAGGLRLMAAHDVPQGFSEARRGGLTQPAPGGALEGATRTKRTVQITDLAATQAYAERHPRMVEAVEIGGIRTVVAVPMLKDNELVGVIAIHRREVLPFTDKQIALLTNFANEAVIAIENTRLLNELRQRTTDLTERTNDLTEALEQQTATSEVLKVISSSPAALEPVFRAMLENATRLCDANFGVLVLREGDAFRVGATHNVPPAFAELRQREPVFRPGPLNPVARVAATKELLHISNFAEDAAYKEHDPAAVIFVELAGTRSLLVLPMLKENEISRLHSISRSGSSSLYRQANRASAELRRPSRHRHREHAAAE